MLSGDETAEDCGGSCAPCPTGAACASGADCKSGVCIGASCAVSKCGDGALNDSETDIDCGGAICAARCEAGQKCKVAGDCASGVCWKGHCEAPTCTDGTQNGDEAGLDCGGSAPECPACP